MEAIIEGIIKELQSAQIRIRKNIKDFSEVRVKQLAKEKNNIESARKRLESFGNELNQFQQSMHNQFYSLEVKQLKEFAGFERKSADNDDAFSSQTIQNMGAMSIELPKYQEVLAQAAKYLMNCLKSTDADMERLYDDRYISWVSIYNSKQSYDNQQSNQPWDNQQLMMPWDNQQSK